MNGVQAINVFLVEYILEVPIYFGYGKAEQIRNKSERDQQSGSVALTKVEAGVGMTLIEAKAAIGVGETVFLARVKARAGVMVKVTPRTE